MPRNRVIQSDESFLADLAGVARVLAPVRENLGEVDWTHCCRGTVVRQSFFDSAYVQRFTTLNHPKPGAGLVDFVHP